jgi:DNA polymerase-3 subunit chi
MTAAMTGVAFHTGLAEPGLYACRLLRKAYRQGLRVLVSLPAERLTAFDRDLWAFDADDFVPHLRLDTSPSASALARTPIWLADGALAPAGPAVWVNLGADGPADPQRFERIVELVSTDETELRAARMRWRAYEAAGLQIVHHLPGEAA